MTTIQESPFAQFRPEDFTVIGLESIVGDRMPQVASARDAKPISDALRHKPVYLKAKSCNEFEKHRAYITNELTDAIGFRTRGVITYEESPDGTGMYYMIGE